MFELVIWPQELTLAKWTQPSGPLCLWQCFYQCLWVTKFCAKFGRHRIPRTASMHNFFIVLRSMWKEPAPFNKPRNISPPLFPPPPPKKEIPSQSMLTMASKADSRLIKSVVFRPQQQLGYNGDDRSGDDMSSWVHKNASLTISLDVHKYSQGNKCKYNQLTYMIFVK